MSTTTKVQIVVLSIVEPNVINKAYFTLDDNTKVIGDAIHTITTTGLLTPCEVTSELVPLIGSLDFLVSHLREGGYKYVFPSAILSIEIVTKF
jgi:hypothetical protein